MAGFEGYMVVIWMGMMIQFDCRVLWTFQAVWFHFEPEDDNISRISDARRFWITSFCILLSIKKNLQICSQYVFSSTKFWEFYTWLQGYQGLSYHFPYVGMVHPVALPTTRHPLGLQAQRLREALAEAEAKIAGVQAGFFMTHGNRFGGEATCLYTCICIDVSCVSAYVFDMYLNMYIDTYVFLCMYSTITRKTGGAGRHLSQPPQLSKLFSNQPNRQSIICKIFEWP